MPSRSQNDARLSFRLPAELKVVIEQAAAALGQSVSDFAIATLVQAARMVIRQRDVTELSNRDRDIFIALLDDVSAKPNKALTEAAREYKKLFGKGTE
jgi:uncharacterized protein (DUF1778 family)